MQIRYFATIRQLTRENERAWARPAATLRELLAGLAGTYGPAFARAVFDGERAGLSPVVIVLINGKDARHQGGIDAALTTDDTVSIFPMIAGG